MFQVVKNLTAVSFLIFTANAQADFSTEYANKAQADYQKATAEAVRVLDAVQIFLENTNEKNLIEAKAVWIEARKAYSVTEIYRFYGGPIDSEEGPEGLINAWPLDEAFIDYVKGSADSGIVNNTLLYPEITKKLLVELNEQNGETNISTGWHAIEFLLWGQDFNITGPGNRPVSDFVKGLGTNADRRRAYLLVASELLVEHLSAVTEAWNPEIEDSFYKTFSSQTEKVSLNKAFTSLLSMSNDELAIERIFVAYDTQFQEDEHSCFSDTTLNDLYYNFLGIKGLWAEVANSASAQNLNSDLNLLITEDLTKLEKKLLGFSLPFDQAIFDKKERERIISIVDKLQSLGDKFKTAATQMGVAL